MTIRRSLVVLGVGAALISAGCGSSNSSGGSSSSAAAASTGAASSASAGTSTAAKSGKPAHVAYLAWTLTDFEQVQANSVKATVEAHGGTMTTYNANFDPATQLQQCQDAVQSHRFNVIVISPVASDTGGVPCVRAAAAAKIPVITLENIIGKNAASISPQVPGVVGVLAYPGPTDVQAVVGVVKQVCKGLNPCNVLGEVTSASDYLTNSVTNAIQKEGGPNVHLVAKFSGQYQAAVAAKALPDLLTAHPDINVYVATDDDTALAGVAPLKKAGLLGKVKIIGNGGSRQGAKAIADGTMTATVGSWPIENGKIAAQDAMDAVNGVKISHPAVNGYFVAKPLVVTKANSNQYTAEWGPQ